MSLTIRQRLLSIENEFLLAMDDLDAAAVFEQKWAELDMDVKSALNANILDEETTALAHSMASQISIAVDLFLSLRATSDDVTKQLEVMFDERLNFGATDVDPASTSTSGPHVSPSSPVPLASPTRLDSSSLPAYIEPAYRWLLKHLHNPYPNKATKQKIADGTGCSIERIADWFGDARRRMGWTAILREEFGRRRPEILDAAKRHFVSPDPKNPLSTSIVGRFVQMKANAEELYGDKLIPSALSLKLSTAVKDLTPELQAQAEKERKLKEEAARLAYPSPAPSSGASSPISDPGASTSRKRSSSDASDGSFDEPSNKRSRTDTGPSSDAFVNALPSPPRSPSPTSADASCRKRRLSDADAHYPKRPRHELSGPRLQAVSAPTIPLTLTLSGTPDILANWFSSDREGNTNQLDDGELLDIKLFDPTSLFQFDVEEPPAPSQHVFKNVVPMPQPQQYDDTNLVFDLPSFESAAELQKFMGTFPYDSVDYFTPADPPSASMANHFSPLSSTSYFSFPYSDPAVFDPTTLDYVDHGYLTSESVAHNMGYDALPLQTHSSFPNGAASGNLIQGLLNKEQNIHQTDLVWGFGDL
ncbi:C-terminal domain of homeodomain 1-domain-containing protein [Mycena rebaudengoi]|nr:C-terminal domain of homeodomain 1-domain-containing protein [Mycena rebaudengoi]